MSAFLFRYHGDDDVEPPTIPSFADVDALHPFVEEVEWMADTEISTGYDDGTFRPSAVGDPPGDERLPPPPRPPPLPLRLRVRRLRTHP